MKFFVALAIAAAATCASAQERKCGSVNPPADLKFETTTEPTNDIVERAARRARYTVDTYVHVITSQNKSDLYPRSMVEEQVSARLHLLTVCIHELITLADACYERSIC